MVQWLIYDLALLVSNVSRWMLGQPNWQSIMTAQGCPDIAQDWANICNATISCFFQDSVLPVVERILLLQDRRSTLL